MKRTTVIAPGRTDLLRRVGVEGIEDALTHTGGRIVVENRTSIVRVLNDPDDPDVEVYVKAYFYPDRRPRWRYAVRKCRAEREFESLVLLTQSRIACAEPLAWGSLRGRFGSLWSCFIATRGVPRSINIETFMKAAADPNSLAADKNFRRRALGRLGTLIGRMHASGYVDHDLHWRNILINVDGPEPEFFIIDSPKGERPKSSRRRRRGIVHDLACIDKHASVVFTRLERARFLAAWLAAVPEIADRDRLFFDVASLQKKLHEKRQRKLAETHRAPVDVKSWSRAERVRERIAEMIRRERS